MIQDRTFYANAAELILKGWCQSAFAKGDCVCPYEAIARALGITHDQMPNDVVDELFRAVNGIDRINRTITEKRGIFFKWHDDPDRTKRQAYRLLMALSIKPVILAEDDTFYEPEPKAPPRRRRTIRRHKRPAKATVLAGSRRSVEGAD